MSGTHAELCTARYRCETVQPPIRGAGAASYGEDLQCIAKIMHCMPKIMPFWWVMLLFMAALPPSVR
eukprot:1883349-Rhodomonas_salina.2